MTGAADDPPALAAEVRALLSRRRPADPFLTYQSVATALGLQPPGTIQRVAAALEQTMREDVQHAVRVGAVRVMATIVCPLGMRRLRPIELMYS
jgi:hypothetical protein